MKNMSGRDGAKYFELEQGRSYDRQDSSDP